MSYGLHYTTTYKRRSGGTTIVDILEKDYAGSTTNLIADKDCVEINLDGDIENIYQPTRGSGATIRLVVPALTLTSLFTVDPQKYIVKIWSDYRGGNLLWQGFISSNIYQENYSEFGLTSITITANDGMSVLENTPYMTSATGTTYTGFVNVATVLSNIFSKLGISFSTIRTSNDLLIADYSRNPFLYLTVNNENYIDEQGVAMSCRKVLDSIFQPLGLSITFRGDIIYMVDPINLHDVSKGYSYGTSPVYGYLETQQNLGGYVDISGTTLDWFATGQVLDVVQPFNQLELKYDPYNFTEFQYSFSDADNVGNNTTYTTINNDGTIYRKYIGVTMKDWTINGIYGFEGIQKITTGSTTTEDTIDYFIKQESNLSGSYEYTIPYSNIKQDEKLRLEFSADFFVNTKHATNLWSNAAGTLVKEIQIPVYIKVGNKWYGGGNSWTTNIQSTTLTLRTPDTQSIQVYSRSGWWLWRHTDVKTIDDSVINDTWTNGKAIIEMGQGGSELINGSIHLYIPKAMVLSSVTPWQSQTAIKNLLIKNVRIVSSKEDLTSIGNDGVNTTATFYTGNDSIIKSPLSIELLHGCGTYGCSKAAFSTDQQPVQGINILGLMRGSLGTPYYDTAKLLAQSIISEYKVPRIKLSARLDVKNYLLSIEQKLITDNRYLSGKSFYISNGTYYDELEFMDVEMIEITSTRENII